ncbi:MAG: protein kinase [Pirellulales bacterium]|nr:protein kinase [Pirellulales bacterium]
MPVTSCEKFYTLLERSGLLTIDQLDAVQKATAEIKDPKALARQLVIDEYLTRWQAAQLLAGGSKLTMGKYRLLEQLGSNPTGKVYLAENPQLDRKVAIKTINRRTATDPEALKRFQQEARTVAILDHRNIVHAYDVDREGNLDMIVMEHVDGNDLKTMVAKNGPLSPWQAANFIHQAAQGLAHAHEKGVTHGDMKPSNLLVDAYGELKIVDMAVARISQGGDDTAGRTAIGYLSPEQVQGARGDEPASDLYSLGSTMYYLLAGKPPFAETSDLRLLLKQQAEGATPLEELRDDIPDDLIAICNRLMATKAAERFGSADEVAEELKEWLEENPPQLESARDESLAEFAIEAEAPRWSKSGAHAAVAVETPKRPAAANRPQQVAAATPAAETFEDDEDVGGLPRNAIFAIGGVAVLLVAIGAFFLFSGNGDADPDEDETAQTETEDDDTKEGDEEPKNGEGADDDPKKGEPDEPVDLAYKPAENELILLEDDTPDGALGTGSENFASWQWVGGDGHQVHTGQLAVLRESEALSRHEYTGPKQPTKIAKGDKLFTYVWLDPKSTPEMMMLEWKTDKWNHRAYWGENKSDAGTIGTASLRNLGPLPAAGEWARLEVPADQVGLNDGAIVDGMRFTQFGGRAYWDTVGVASSDGSEDPMTKPDPTDVAKPDPKPKPDPPPKPKATPRPAGEPETPKDPTMVIAQSHPVEIIKVSSDKGVKLVEQPDGAIRAEGPNPKSPTYEVVIKTSLPRITGVKLECLADEPLPAKGPGRGKDGTGIISDIKVSATEKQDLSGMKPVALLDAVADYEAPKSLAKSAVDGKPNTNWSTAGKPGEDRWLVASFKKPINDTSAADKYLKITLKHAPNSDASVGCFRIRALTGRESSAELATVPEFPAPPNPFAELPSIVSLPRLGEAGSDEAMELGPAVFRDPRFAEAYLLGGEGATTGRESFTVEESTEDHPSWQVKLGTDGFGVNVARLDARDGKIWFQWLPASAEKKASANLSNCILVLASGNDEHRITLRHPTEVDPIPLSPMAGRPTSSFKITNAPKADLVKWEFIDLAKSLPDATTKPEAPFTIKQRVQIGLGAEANKDVVLQVTPSSTKIQVAQFFRIADNQKPQRLIAKSIERMASQLKLNQQRLTLRKTQMEAIKDAKIKKQLKPQLDLLIRELTDTNSLITRLAGVEEQAKALAEAQPLRYRIYYEVDPLTKVVLVEAK